MIVTEKDFVYFPTKILRTIENGVDAVIPVATACACAGIIIGIITLTGLGLKFSSLVTI